MEKDLTKEKIDVKLTSIELKDTLQMIEGMLQCIEEDKNEECKMNEETLGIIELLRGCAAKA